MKPVQLVLLITITMLFAWPGNLRASQRATPEQLPVALLKKAVERTSAQPDRRLEKRLEKKATRLLKKLSRRAAIDLNDPVEKWMWFWLLAWGGGLVLSVLGLGWLGWLLFVGGTVCLVIWLVRRSGVG